MKTLWSQISLEGHSYQPVKKLSQCKLQQTDKQTKCHRAAFRTHFGVFL